MNSRSSPPTSARSYWPTAGARHRRDIDPLPVVRLFTPDAHATWLLAALDPADGDTAYGLIDLGIGMPALGTVQAVRSGVHRRAAASGPRCATCISGRCGRCQSTSRLAQRDRLDSPTDEPSQRAIRAQAVAAHCVFLSLTQDRLGLNPHSCTEAVRL